MSSQVSALCHRLANCYSKKKVVRLRGFAVTEDIHLSHSLFVCKGVPTWRCTKSAARTSMECSGNAWMRRKRGLQVDRPWEPFKVTFCPFFVQTGSSWFCFFRHGLDNYEKYENRHPSAPSLSGTHPDRSETVSAFTAPQDTTFRHRCPRCRSPQPRDTASPTANMLVSCAFDRECRTP